MKLVDRKISIVELRKMAEQMFGDMVKAVVDVRKRIMAVDAELHSDQETYLLETGSQQKDLWGINLYPELEGDDFVEFDSMINLRPSQGNRSRDVLDPEIRKKILEIVNGIVER